MKKLLYNKARTKIFNLDHLVSIQRYIYHSIEGVKSCGMILKFFSEDYFLVTPGESETLRKHFKIISGYGNPQDIAIYRNLEEGNFEENKKLFEYFENKFTKSALCQKTNG